jgi:uncharacterized protein YjiS (DUF1127 family)
MIAAHARAFAAAVNAAVTFVRATWKARRHRREVERLLGFDDRALADIGITRGDLRVCLAGSGLEDPSVRLRVLAVERRAGRRAQIREWLAAEDAASPVAPTPAPISAVADSV